MTPKASEVISRICRGRGEGSILDSEIVLKQCAVSCSFKHAEVPGSELKLTENSQGTKQTSRAKLNSKRIYRAAPGAFCARGPALSGHSPPRRGTELVVPERVVAMQSFSPEGANEHSAKDMLQDKPVTPHNCTKQVPLLTGSEISS